MVRSERYGYAVSRLRAMENRFVEASVIQRMLESEDFMGAFKVLGETCYVDWMSEAGGETQYDRVVEAELRYVLDEARRFVPDEELVDFYRVPYDFHNVKVILKSGFLKARGQERRWDLLTSLGTVDSDDLITAIESEDYRMLPYGLSSVVPECLAIWEQSHDLLEVERRIDSQLFSTLRDLALKGGHRGVRDWIAARVDAENVRNLGRLKRTNADLAKVKSFLHGKGHIGVDQLLGIYSEPFEFWGRAMAYTSLGPTLGNLASKDVPVDLLLVEMERMLDDYVTSVIHQYRYSTFAPENILRYLWMKEMETKNIRIILVGKSNGADRDVLRRLLRHV